MSADGSQWAGAPVANTTSAQLTAQQAMAQAMAQMAPTDGIVRGAQAPSTAVVQQTGPVTEEEYATGKYAPFDPTGWTSQGGNSDTTVYKNDKTGEIVYVDASGRVEDHFANEAEANGAGMTPAQALGSLVKGAKDTVSDIVSPILPSFGLSGPTNIPPEIAQNIQGAIAQQNAIAAQMGQDRANYQNVAAPTAAGPGTIAAAMAGQVSPIQAGLANAMQAQAAQQAPAILTPQQAAIQAQIAAAAQIAPTTLANAATLDPAQQAQMRAAQQGLISGLQGAINGTDPSIAAIMLRQATDRNVANQYALAQAANGMNTGLAQRTAMINAADMNQTAIAQQAMLRAQEIQAARGQLGSVLDSARGADIALATNQAGLQQQTNLANAGALNATAAQQAQLQQAAALQNAQLAQQAGTTNATLAQQVALANSASQNDVNEQNAQLQQAAGLQNAQLGTQASIANAGNQTQANTASAQLANAVNLANANNQSQANTAAAQLNTQAAIANANNQVSTNALNQKAINDLTQNQLTATGQSGQTSVGYGNTYANLADAQAKRDAAVIQGITSGAATLLK